MNGHRHRQNRSIFAFVSRSHGFQSHVANELCRAQYQVPKIQFDCYRRHLFVDSPHQNSLDREIYVQICHHTTPETQQTSSKLNSNCEACVGLDNARSDNPIRSPRRIMDKKIYDHQRFHTTYIVNPCMSEIVRVWCIQSRSPISGIPEC